jgi:HSP20 family molecular chaperone IbpA
MHDRPALGVMGKRWLSIDLERGKKKKKKENGFFHQERGYLKFSQTS